MTAARDPRMFLAAATYGSALALGSVTSATVVAAIGSDSAVFLQALCGWLIATGIAALQTRKRRHIAAYLRELEPTHWMLLGLAFVGVFAAPLVARHEWSPLRGLIALQVPWFLLLVTPSGFASYYLLCGMTVALALTKLNTVAGLAALGGFLLALVLSITFEHFTFRMETAHRAPSGLWIIALRAAITPVAVTLIAACAAFLASWQMTPIHEHRRHPIPDSMAGTRQFEWDFSTYRIFVLTIPLTIGVVMLLIGLRYLYLRLRRRDAVSLPPPEEDVVQPQRIVVKRQKRRRFAPRDAREAIVAYFLAFCTAMSKHGRGRAPTQTPAEYKDSLASDSQLAPLIEEIVACVERARYAPTPPSDSDVWRFRTLVQRTLDTLKNRTTE